MANGTRIATASKPSVELHHEMVQKADLEREVTAVLLDACPLFRLEPGQLDTRFLLELSSVVILRRWEEEGLREHLDAGLPSYHEAAEDFAKRAALGPDNLQDTCEGSLFLRLLNVYPEKFAGEGRLAFDADFVLGDISEDDEDELVDVLVNFLWDNRNTLSGERPDELPIYPKEEKPDLVPDYEMIERLNMSHIDPENAS